MNDVLTDYLETVAGEPRLTDAEMRALAVVIQTGDVVAARRAQDRLVRGNLRLVVFAGRRYRRDGIDQSDLLSEGNLGLIHAARKYDGRTAFATYAMWWIRSYMLSFVQRHGRLVTLPAEIGAGLWRLGKVRQEVGSTTSYTELATQARVPEAAVPMLLAELDGALSWDACALDESLAPPDASADIDQHINDMDLYAALARRTATERMVLMRYFGLGRRRSQSIEQIASVTKHSRRWVATVLAQALAALRNDVRLVLPAQRQEVEA